MISKIKLQNFQSHKDSEIQFCDKINIISGSSNSGKTAIINSINWILNGEPSGNEIINYDSKECKVKLEIENNEIQKVKSDKENYYIVNDKKLDKVGQSVPEEIYELTNFNELNLQMQYDKFFLLQDSAGERARVLNKIINLEVIDNTIKKAKSKVNNKSREIDNLESNIVEIKNNLKSYDNLEEFEKKLLSLESKEIEYNKLNDKIKSISSIKIELDNLKVELEKYKNIEIKKTLFKKLKDNFKIFDIENRKYNELLKLKNELESNKIELSKYEDLSNKKSKLESLKNKIELLKKEKNKVVLMEEYKLNNLEIESLNKKIEKLRKEKRELLPVGSQCPICRRIIE